MKYLRIVNRTRDRTLGSRVGLADQWWLRARGFMGRAEPGPGEGLLLSPCRGVHMIGMKFSLDVILLDRQGRVAALHPELGPGRRTAWHARARYALEVPAGTIRATDTREGDLVAWLPAEDARSEDGTRDAAAADGGRDAGAALPHGMEPS
jgi:uncharacterized membrane protein (UPF0127 family)